MPVKGVKSVNKKINSFLSKQATRTTERVVQEILIEGLSHAISLAPMDTSTLVNSQFTNLRPISNGIRGEAGFSASYAAHVHEAKGTLKGQDRPNSRGQYWSPNAEPEFLKKGFERDGLESIKQIIKRGYKI